MFLISLQLLEIFLHSYDKVITFSSYTVLGQNGKEGLVRSITMKMIYKNRSRKVGIAGILVAATLTLAACGDAGTSTPLPQPTAAVATTAPAAVATTAAAGVTTAAAANNGAANNNAGTGTAPGAANGTPGGANRGNLNPPLNGTIESYDATIKVLTVKGADGTSQKFDATNARIIKPQTITASDLGQLSAGNDIIQVVGQQGTDGSYNATRLTVVDPATFNGPNGGFGGGNGGSNPRANGGTPGAGGGRGQGFNGTPPANFTPGAGGGRFGNGGPNGIIVRGGTVSGNKLTGTDFAGQAITVNLSATTVIVKQTAGSATDLKAGQNVLVTYRMGQGAATATAMAITLEQ